MGSARKYSIILVSCLIDSMHFYRMSDAYKIHKQSGAYFITMQVVFWVDLFCRKRYRDIIIDSLKYNINHKGLSVYAYVIMSNHIHLLISAENKNLSEVICRIKSFTSKQLIQSILSESERRRDWMLEFFHTAATRHKRNNNYQIWTHENHAEECYSPWFTWQKISYIHNNPVRAGIVRCAEDYIYSSASNYFGSGGLISVDVIHPHLLIGK